LIAAALAALVVLQSPASPAAGDTVAGRARITYLMGSTVYLDAGREDGLVEGHELRVVRGGQRIAALRVSSLASHRAACSVEGTVTLPLAVGDTVEFTPVPAAVAAAEVMAAGASRTGTRSRTSPVRGRVGLRFLLVRPPGAPGFTQPGLDLRLEATQLGAVPIGFTMDVRGRRTYRTLSDGTVNADRRDAVYQAALFIRPGGPVRATVGRQYLPTISSISLFDGALLEYQTARVGAGVFAGSEPEPATMGWSSTVKDLGLFLEGRSAPGARARWTLAGGAVGSYAEGVVNREFGFIQGSLAVPGFTMFLAQELDVNRDWKADAGDPPVALTATFLSLVAQPVGWASLQAGLDNRRNVRLYHDYANPEAAFDDSFRQGAWAGAGFTFGRARLGFDGRATFGGADSASRTRSGSASLALERLTRARLGVRGRLTRYASPGREGWLQTYGLSLRPVSWGGIEANGGSRRETVAGEMERNTRWIGADLDFTLGRSFYVLFSGSHETGTMAAGDQGYLSLSFRF
jgi:hypothetical protein